MGDIEAALVDRKVWLAASTHAEEEDGIHVDSTLRTKMFIHLDYVQEHSLLSYSSMHLSSKTACEILLVTFESEVSIWLIQSLSRFIEFTTIYIVDVCY